MGLSKRIKSLSQEEIDRVMEMAWEDRTPFEAIQIQFDLAEKDVIQLMKREMKLSSWKMWRKRVSGRKTKHQKLSSNEMMRFRSKAQRTISGNKISKR